MLNIYKIKIISLDVDGTLTDGKIYIGENGELMKAFCVKDGYAIHKMLPQNDIVPVLITARKSLIVENRAKELNVSQVFQGVQDKLALLSEIAEAYGCTFAEIAYFGDDIGDVECIKACGLSGCPQDAVDEVKACVDFVSDKNGGSGAARDFITYIIEKNREARQGC